MSDTSDLIGQVRKLDGRPVVIIGVSGNDVQVDHWAGSPWTPIVHVDRLGEMPPWIWTDERLAVLRQQAVERLGVWNDARALALGTLSLIHAFEHREKCAEDVERGLAEEGKALDDVVRERDEARREWDALRLALDNSQAECRELRTAHEQALHDRDKAWKLIHEGFSEARIQGFELGKSTTLNEAAEQAADAIREFGILNRELAAVNTALQPVAGKGESVSACVARLVKRLAEQDAELTRLRGEVKALSAGAVKPARNPTVRTFTREYLRDDLGLPGDDDFEVTSWPIEHRDHDVLYGIIFRTPETLDGYAWRTTYSVSTGQDEAGPWEYQDDVRCTLVRLSSKTVPDWVPAVMPEPSSEPEAQSPIAEMAATNGDGDDLAESIADFRKASADVKESLQGVVDGMTELVGMVDNMVDGWKEADVNAFEPAHADDVIDLEDIEQRRAYASSFRVRDALPTTDGADNIVVHQAAIKSLSIRAKQVLDHLRATGPQRGEQIRKQFGIGSSDWNKVKDELLDAKVIRKFGEARGAQYEAIA